MPKILWNVLYGFENFRQFIFQYISKIFFQLLETNPEAGIMNEYVQIDFKFYFGIFIAV